MPPDGAPRDSPSLKRQNNYLVAGVRTVGDMGCEKIHKEKKKRQRANFYSLSKGGKGHGVAPSTSSEMWGF